MTDSRKPIETTPPSTSSTVTLTIDGREVSVEHGTTILDAARAIGIRIPTLCHVDGIEPSASCFLCAVEVEGRSTLAPSCAMPATHGMVIQTQSETVRDSRRMALELLFSDHVGDCVGPCRTGCPARLDIPGFITLLTEDDERRAAEVVADHLTLPASLGRICPRYCEQQCRRCEVGEPISIAHLHRFVADGDLASSSPYLPKKAAATGKTVAIVGAGPAGLTAAHNLLRRGHGAVLFDAHPEPGGMLRYGIPAFRLPRRVLDQEIATVRALGGDFRMGQRMGRDFSLDDLRHRYDAVFLGIGAQGSRRLGCAGEELAMPVLEFLERVAEDRPPEIGSDVVVVGGGNSAMDAARTAVRLGGRAVRVLYRRTRREMPCLMSEVEGAEAEGVRIETLVAPVRLTQSAGGGLHLTCQRMELGEPDESGRARPVPVPGSEFTVEASTVIAAIGQTVETDALSESGLALSSAGVVADPLTLATNVEGVFAGGDGVTGADVAVRAVAAGKLAAVSIGQYLESRSVQGHPEMLNVLMGKLSEAELAELFRRIEEGPSRARMPELPIEWRVRNFDEVELGLPTEVARQEGGRCMSCGCWKAATCRLRQYGTEYGVDPLRFAGERRSFHRDESHPQVVYESGKCILCGACIAAAVQADEKLGLSFVGRGFEATVAVPLRGTLVEALPRAARAAADVCPTGAFALKAPEGPVYPLEFVKPSR
jgi:formate dehydrogenase major subunit